MRSLFNKSLCKKQHNPSSESKIMLFVPEWSSTETLICFLAIAFLGILNSIFVKNVFYTNIFSGKIYVSRIFLGVIVVELLRFLFIKKIIPNKFEDKQVRFLKITIKDIIKIILVGIFIAGINPLKLGAEFVLGYSSARNKNVNMSMILSLFYLNVNFLLINKTKEALILLALSLAITPIVILIIKKRAV